MTITYPKDFDTCPACGSKDRIIKGEVDLAIDEGRLKVGARIPILQTRALIFDPGVAPILAPKTVRAIYTFYDACANCGCLYVVHVEEGTAVVESAQQSPKGGAPPFPFFG